ncbi:MAG: DUF2059 domain-containing protein [Myxococcota bacterium]|jgi:hypothetical protein|nr:DUF2059 domain-containing protein [Myxococcota bacterium]
MTRFSTFTLALLLSMALARPALAGSEDQAAPEETEFRQDIRKLMVLTGAGDLGTQVMKQMIDMFKQTYVGVPSEFWDRFLEQAGGDELVDLVIPLYERHLTHEDVKGLIAFYESPLGRKLVSKQPLIMEESMLVGQQWGAQLGEDVLGKLKEEGY